ncbi:Light-harvesting protein [Rhodovastum atsumiense]|uniref:Light-harvesting protein n=1 Tax=Rhodovastum atsumiense TaxID=504468 RepID=A0A5M6J0U6_9PROT|nr:light-harvesting antenna LH1, alpha subunit [Rhodovastum atsumiense]KAA5613238.1 light-harvesting protein [Rhodovastum atsumiense]CAH2600605.1 Light-harvesting protein [Rhodovastum atsumiense]
MSFLKDDPSWQLWLFFDPKKVVPATLAGLFAFALFIHAALLTTHRFNWIESFGQRAYPAQALPLPVVGK